MPAENLNFSLKRGKYLKIKDWNKSDRPREKLIEKGISALSDAELLGIIINSGVPNLSAVDLAKDLLKNNQNDLNLLSKKSVFELQKYKGIGAAKAVKIVSALELSNRRKFGRIPERFIIDSPNVAFEFIKTFLNYKSREEFWAIFLTKTNKFIDKHLISVGGMAETLVDPIVIFREAINSDAVKIILTHNHPSGDIKPSKEDIEITKNLCLGAKHVGFTIIDHIIFTDTAYFSFTNEKLI